MRHKKSKEPAAGPDVPDVSRREFLKASAATLPAFSFVGLSVSSCGSNETGCYTDDQCPDGYICHTQQQRCLRIGTPSSGDTTSSCAACSGTSTSSGETTTTSSCSSCTGSTTSTSSSTSTSGCSSCSGSCSSSCADSCHGACSGTCSGGCKNLTS